jgi:hypothetical protein
MRHSRLLLALTVFLAGALSAQAQGKDARSKLDAIADAGGDRDPLAFDGPGG